MAKKTHSKATKNQKKTPISIDEYIRENLYDEDEEEVEVIDPEMERLLVIPLFYTFGEEDFEERMAEEIAKHRVSLTEDERNQLDIINFASRWELLRQGLISEEEAENNLFFRDDGDSALFPIPIAKIEKAENALIAAKIKRAKRKKKPKPS